LVQRLQTNDHIEITMSIMKIETTMSIPIDILHRIIRRNLNLNGPKRSLRQNMDRVLEIHIEITTVIAVKGQTDTTTMTITTDIAIEIDMTDITATIDVVIRDMITVMEVDRAIPLRLVVLICCICSSS